MRETELHFTEQFAGETVIISVDGAATFTVEKLKTNPRKSLARIVRVQLPERGVEVAVEIAGKGGRVAAMVDPAVLKWIAVGLTGGKLTLTPLTEEEYRREPRGYG